MLLFIVYTYLQWVIYYLYVFILSLLVMNFVVKYRVWIPKAFLVFAYLVSGYYSLMLDKDFMEFVLEIWIPESLSQAVLILFWVAYISLALYLLISKKPHKYILAWAWLWPLIMFVLYNMIGVNIGLLFQVLMAEQAWLVYLYHYILPKSNKIIA